MSDTNETPEVPVVQKGYTTDPDGDLSSGRLAKIVSLWTSVGTAFSGLTVASVALFTGKVDATTFVGLILGIIGVFAGIVLGNEITQKVTGK